MAQSRARTGFCVAALLVAAFCGCSDRSTTSDSANGTTGGMLSVYVRNVPGAPVRAAEVTFSALQVHSRTENRMVDLLRGREITIDLVAAHDDPYVAGFLGNFTVPAGDYDGIGTVTMKTVSFTTAANRTCTDPRFPMAAGPLTMPGAGLALPVNGTATLFIDLPIASGTCTAPGDVDGRLDFDLARAACRPNP
jgi:hypothetical protein